VSVDVREVRGWGEGAEGRVNVERAERQPTVSSSGSSTSADCARDRSCFLDAAADRAFALADTAGMEALARRGITTGDAVTPHAPTAPAESPLPCTASAAYCCCCCCCCCRAATSSTTHALVTAGRFTVLCTGSTVMHTPRSHRRSQPRRSSVACRGMTRCVATPRFCGGRERASLRQAARTPTTLPIPCQQPRRVAPRSLRSPVRGRGCCYMRDEAIASRQSRYWVQRTTPSSSSSALAAPHVESTSAAWVTRRGRVRVTLAQHTHTATRRYTVIGLLHHLLR
jgi:hypothetical protein